MAEGFYEGHMAVEFYKGEWILRARLSSDQPASESPDAAVAIEAWRARNRAKFESIQEPHHG